MVYISVIFSIHHIIIILSGSIGKHLIKNAALHLCLTTNSVISGTLHLNPADSWLDLLKTWGWRKSHAVSKIDLGPVFREKDEGHPVLSFSIPCLPAASCILSMWESSSYDINIKSGRKVKGLWIRSDKAFGSRDHRAKMWAGKPHTLWIRWILKFADNLGNFLSYFCLLY